MYLLRKNRQWLIFLLIAGGISSAGFLLFEKSFKSSSSSAPPWKTYENKASGYRLQYPGDWVLEATEDSTNSVIFSNPRQWTEEVTVSVADAKLVDVVRQSLGEGEKEIIMVDGITGSKITLPPARHTTTRFNALVVRGDRLFYIAGNSPLFDAIVKSIEFINN